MVSGAPGSGMDWAPRPRPAGDVTMAGLLVLIQLDAMRAGIDAVPLPGWAVRLSVGELAETMALAEACAVLVHLLGDRANLHVRHFALKL
jgi:hypothetical protein